MHMRGGPDLRPWASLGRKAGHVQPAPAVCPWQLHPLAAPPPAPTPSHAQTSFITVVYPSLVCAYLGQTAVIIDNRAAAPTAFWSSVPKPVYWPTVVRGGALRGVGSLSGVCVILNPRKRPFHGCSVAVGILACTRTTSLPSTWPSQVIATLAAVLASQAMITGCFSIVQQVRGLVVGGGGHP